MIPGLALDRREPVELLVALRRRLYEHQLPSFGYDNDVIAGQEGLPVTVAAALPFQIPGCGVDARQNRLVQTVDVALVQEGAGELVLHPGVPPHRAGRQPLAGARYLEHRGALTVPG